MTEAAETSIKVISFSGAKKDWEIWKYKFLARASRKGYKDLLTGKEAIPAGYKDVWFEVYS